MYKTLQIQKKLFNLLLLRNSSYKSVRRPDFASARKLTAPQIERTSEDEEKGRNLTKNIRNKILATGPITVAEYMREVLTNPFSGYYMHNDVFGREGDFTTSPEISQIFGELVGIWLLSEWQKMGSPSPFQVVELGPGRGTLARDILKVFAKFKLGGQFSLHMIEISPYLSKLQAQRFCYKHAVVEDNDGATALPYYQHGETASGAKAFWYKRLEDVPEGFSVFVAHEFFDAMPVHKLQLDGGIWKEILIDVAKEDDKGRVAAAEDFRFVLSNSQTPISRIYQPMKGEVRECLEYSIETDRIVGMMTERLERDGGIGLIMDYGHFGEKTDTFRAFKKHKLHEPLKDPGTADLTADVDFRQIKQFAENTEKVVCYGPVEQGEFLKKMQGDVRLENLLANALPENVEAIKSGYEMLTDAKQMGKRFKFFAMFPAVLREHLEKFPVNGFH